MKTEFLKELGLEKEVIDKILAENGKDIEAEKAKLTAKEAEISTANQTIKDLQDTVKKYDGKDPVKLQDDLKLLQDKYDTDIANEKAKAEQLQKEYSLKDALKSAGVVDPDYLIYKHGGVDKFTFTTDGKPVDVEKVTETYKETSPAVFTSATPKITVSTGMRHTGSGEGPSKRDEANAALRSAFGKEN